MAKDTQAFPRAGFSGPYRNGDAEDGMTLRDYFAAKALQGICAANPTLDWTNDAIAKDAYRLADAMMKARDVPLNTALETFLEGRT